MSGDGLLFLTVAVVVVVVGCGFCGFAGGVGLRGWAFCCCNGGDDPWNLLKSGRGPCVMVDDRVCSFLGGFWALGGGGGGFGVDLCTSCL